MAFRSVGGVAGYVNKRWPRSAPRMPIHHQVRTGIGQGYWAADRFTGRQRLRLKRLQEFARQTHVVTGGVRTPFIAVYTFLRPAIPANPSSPEPNRKTAGGIGTAAILNDVNVVVAQESAVPVE